MAKTNTLTSHHGESNTSRADKIYSARVEGSDIFEDACSVSWQPHVVER